MLRFQFWWPHWYKWWPYYNTEKEDVLIWTFTYHIFCIGPLQFIWDTSENINKQKDA